MNKKYAMWFLIGWAFSIVFPPSHITGMLGKKKG